MMQAIEGWSSVDGLSGRESRAKWLHVESFPDYVHDAVAHVHVQYGIDHHTVSPLLHVSSDVTGHPSEDN